VANDLERRTSQVVDKEAGRGSGGKESDSREKRAKKSERRGVGLGGGGGGGGGCQVRTGQQGRDSLRMPLSELARPTKSEQGGGNPVRYENWRQQSMF